MIIYFLNKITLFLYIDCLLIYSENEQKCLKAHQIPLCQTIWKPVNWRLNSVYIYIKTVLLCRINPFLAFKKTVIDSAKTYHRKGRDTSIIWSCNQIFREASWHTGPTAADPNKSSKPTNGS